MDRGAEASSRTQERNGGMNKTAEASIKERNQQVTSLGADKKKHGLEERGCATLLFVLTVPSAQSHGHTPFWQARRCSRTIQIVS